MNLKAILGRMGTQGATPDAAQHARLDAALRSLAAEQVEVVHRVLDRWADAGHPPDSAPTFADLQPDDTGNVFDADRKVLIATPGEWEIYERTRREIERALTTE